MLESGTEKQEGTMATLFIVLLILFQAVTAQTDEITQIRDYYNHVKEHLDDEYGLYTTEISINTEDGIYPALGNYQEEITLHWGSEGGYSWLVLATWNGEFASHHEYGEVLFSEPKAPWNGDTEELLFEFVSFDNSDNIYTELRWWYSGGELLQSAGQTTYPDEVFEYVPTVPDDNDYAHNPAELLEIFNSIHR